MKNETLPEAAERFRQMSAAEKEGFAAASEGQLVAVPEERLIRRAEALDAHDDERLQALEDAKHTGGEFIDEDFEPGEAGDDQPSGQAGRVGVVSGQEGDGRRRGAKKAAKGRGR